MSRPVLAAGGMYVVVMGVKFGFRTNPGSIPNLLLLIVVGATVYSAAILTMHRRGYREVLGLMTG